MKINGPRRLVWALLAVVLPTVAMAAPPTPSPSPAAARSNNAGPQTYDSFRLVHTRNVFDPDRRPVRPPGSDDRRRAHAGGLRRAHGHRVRR